MPKTPVFFEVADGKHEWAQSHAYIPTPLVLPDRIRVFIAFWDNQQVGRIGYVDVNKNNPLKIINISSSPVLDIGEPGTFDDNGVCDHCISFKNNVLPYWHTDETGRAELDKTVAKIKEDGTVEPVF